MPKQYFTLNPTGRPLDDTSCSVGRSLILKMGFIDGEGLGKKGDGIINPVKPVANFSSMGLGATAKVADSSFKQLDDFSSILKNLQSKKKGDSKVKTDIKSTSLEEKSAKSKSRIHYAKFMRSKDVSKFDQKSLKAIFCSEKQEKALTERDQSDNGVDESPNDPATEYPMNYKSTLSMSDYFNKRRSEILLQKTEVKVFKAGEKSDKNSLASDSPLESKEVEFHNEEKPSNIVLKVEDSPKREEQSAEQTREQSSEHPKKSKKKNMKSDPSEGQDCQSPSSIERVDSPKPNDDDTVDQVSSIRPKTSKKKKKKFEDLEAQDGLDDDDDTQKEPDQEDWQVASGKKRKLKSTSCSKNPSITGEFSQPKEVEYTQYETNRLSSQPVKVDLSKTSWKSTNVHLIKGYSHY